MVTSEGLAAHYVPLPRYHQSFEVPYGFYAPTPSVVAYCGTQLRLGFERPEWTIFVSERAMWAAAELMYAARAGRLWRLPPALCSSITQFGVRHLTANQPDADDLWVLLTMIVRIRWHMVPERQRHVPKKIGVMTPVFPHGYRVEWDPVEWSPKVDQVVLVAADPSNGFPFAPVPVSPRVFGTGEGLVHFYSHQGGPTPDPEDGREEYVGGSLAGPHVEVRSGQGSTAPRDMLRAEGAFRHFLHGRGLITPLRTRWNIIRPTLSSVAD